MVYSANQIFIKGDFIMKIIIATLIAFTASLSMATCLGEAQIIAKASEVTRSGAASCHVIVDAYSVVQFNPSYVCPLDIDEVLASGIEVGTTSEKCSLEAGQDFSGVVYKNADGKIVLE